MIMMIMVMIDLMMLVRQGSLGGLLSIMMVVKIMMIIDLMIVRQGLLGGILSIMMAGLATESAYGHSSR